MRDGSVSGIKENERFAMHSVMKFPQALYVADYLSRKGVALDPRRNGSSVRMVLLS